MHRSKRNADITCRYTGLYTCQHSWFTSRTLLGETPTSDRTFHFLTASISPKNRTCAWTCVWTCVWKCEGHALGRVRGHAYRHVRASATARAITTARPLVRSPIVTRRRVCRHVRARGRDRDATQSPCSAGSLIRRSVRCSTCRSVAVLGDGAIAAAAELAQLPEHDEVLRLAFLARFVAEPSP